MASSVLVAPPPKDTPFFNKAGRINDPWVAWFGSITSAATVIQNLQVLNIIAEDNSTDANMAASVTEILDALALTEEPRRAAAVVESSDAGAWRAECGALREEIAELRALLAAGDPLPGALVAQLAPVSSVFGRTGDVSAQSSDYAGIYDASGAAAAAQAASLQKGSNLSDVSSASAARSNLGLGTAAVQNTTAFDAAGAASAAVAGIPNASNAATGLLTSADWSTFNAKQAALFSAWSTWAPTIFSGVGFSGLLVRVAQFFACSHGVFVRLTVDVTTAAGAANAVTLTAPVNPVNNFDFLATCIQNTTTGVPSLGYAIPTSGQGFYCFSQAFTTAGTYRIFLNGFYQT